MSQTKQKSFLEALVNTFVGMIITFAVSPVIYWACGIEMSTQKMGIVTVLFTVVSVIRNYVIRRFFNKNRSLNKEPLHRLLFTLIPLPKQKPTKTDVSYIELYDTYLMYKVVFEADEPVDPEDDMMGNKTSYNDFYVKILKKQIVGCERLFTDDGNWRVNIIINGISQDLRVYFKKSKGQESLEFVETINNWVFNNK